jgi:hypothetical protein
VAEKRCDGNLWIASRVHRERPARLKFEKVTLTINGKRDTKASNSLNKNSTGEKPKKHAFTISHSPGRERGVPSRNSECDNDNTLDHQTQTTSSGDDPLPNRSAYNIRDYNRI